MSVLNKMEMPYRVDGSMGTEYSSLHNLYNYYVTIL